MFHAGENVRTNRAAYHETHPGMQGGYQSTHAPQEAFYEITHGVYEGNHAGLLLPPSMGRVPFSDLSLNGPPPATSGSSPPAAIGRKKAPRLALTRSTLLAAERQTTWHDQLRYASASTGSHSGSDKIVADDSFSVANSIPAANEQDDGGEPEPSSEEWEKRMLECFDSVNDFSKHIKAWAGKILGTVRPTFLEEDEKGHWYCDVDLTTGKTLDPVLFPTTHRDESPLEDAGVAWRRRTQTAASVSRKYVLHLENHPTAEELPDTDQSNGGVRLHEYEAPEQGAHPTKATDNGSTAPSTGFTGGRTVQELEPELPRSPVIQVNKPASPAPATFSESSSTAPFYMRRAGEKDLVGALNIYNREVIKGTQATDTDVLALEDVVRIWQTCQDRGLPFLVVMEGRTSAEQGQQVVGFGFYSDAQPGLSGRSRKSGPWSVKANIYVKNSHRHRGVGSALLDRLLSISSQSYVASAKGASPIPFLDPAREQPHEYLHVFVEILCGSPEGLAETWYRRVLTGRFGFESPGSFTKDAHWSPAAQCWLGKLLFRHDCRCAAASAQEQTQGDAAKAPHGEPDKSPAGGMGGGNGGLYGPGVARVEPSAAQRGQPEFW